MLKPQLLKKGDKVAIISLSSGMLGESFAKHELILGEKRLREFGLEPVYMPNSLKGIAYLKENPKARAEDLKTAFLDNSIKGIICAIGGDDTYRTLPYLLEDKEFIEAVKNIPKLFTGFSDTTINHLMFYKLGLATFYGPTFIVDLAEFETEMLPYTKTAFEYYFNTRNEFEIKSSPIWYIDRTEFDESQVGTKRKAVKETRGYEVLQGSGIVKGRLLGGCLESLYEIVVGGRYEDQKQICDKYKLFPSLDEWKDKILFIETSEEKPEPAKFEQMLQTLKGTGIFDVIKAIIVGKPQDEVFYEEYKELIKKVVSNKNLPIMYNLNFGHAFPRTTLSYGILTEINFDKKTVKYLESALIKDKMLNVKTLWKEIMKTIFLTSDVGASVKVNGVRVVSRLNNTNGFVDNLKLYIRGDNLLVCVASSPNWHEGSMNYARLTFESFNLSGIPFKEFICIDGENLKNAEQIISKADMVFLMGGHTQTQMKMFEEMGLAKILKKYNGVIVGQSAGALNLADEVYCSPEADEEINDERYFKGLGLTKINIEPHYNNHPYFESGKLKNDILLPDSKIKPFIAITDGSYIIVDGKSQTIYGEAYLFKNGTCTQICKNTKDKKLNEKIL